MKTYKAHYFDCQRAFGSTEFHHDLYDLTLKSFQPGEDNELFKFPENWLDLVAAAREKIDARLNDPSTYYKDPADKQKGSESEELLIKFNDIYDIPELEAIARAILPSLEQNLFYSYCHVSHLHTYKNLISDAPDNSSFKAHWDNKQPEYIKMLVYLSAADERSGAMKILVHSETGDAVKMPSSRLDYTRWGPPLHPGNRVLPEVLEGLYRRGYIWKSIVGEAGTILLFDANIIHKAEKSVTAERLVANYLVRPCIQKLDRYIDKRFCGGFNANSPIVDPEALTPEWK